MVAIERKDLSSRWRVGEDISSDHLPMLITTRLGNVEQKRHINKHWLYEKCDIEKLQEEIRMEGKKWLGKQDEQDVNIIYDNYAKTLIKAASKSCPINTNKEKKWTAILE